MTTLQYEVRKVEHPGANGGNISMHALYLVRRTQWDGAESCAYQEMFIVEFRSHIDAEMAAHMMNRQLADMLAGAH